MIKIILWTPCSPTVKAAKKWWEMSISRSCRLRYKSWHVIWDQFSEPRPASWLTWKRGQLEVLTTLNFWGLNVHIFISVDHRAWSTQVKKANVTPIATRKKPASAEPSSPFFKPKQVEENTDVSHGIILLSNLSSILKAYLSSSVPDACSKQVKSIAKKKKNPNLTNTWGDDRHTQTCMMDQQVPDAEEEGLIDRVI